MPQFQILSDVHIEREYPNMPVITDYITPSCDNVILAGDIGNIYYDEQLYAFLLSAKTHFKTVIYILGNNEFYNKHNFIPLSLNAAFARVNAICERLGIILLQNSCIETDELIIFGSTWWSYAPDTPTKEFSLPIYMTHNRMMEIEDFNMLHLQSKKVLNSVIEQKGNKKLIVISHYCPTRYGTMNINHKRDDSIAFTPYYFSASEKYLSKDKVDTWIFGHTHVFRDFYFNNTGTRLISNASPEKKYFKQDFVVDL